MAFTDGWGLQIAICKALGINADETTTLTVVLNAEHAPRILTRSYMTQNQEQALIRVFEQASFEAREDGAA